MKLGQNEGVKKLRELRKDIARIKTIARERELGCMERSQRTGASERRAGQEQKKARKKAKKELIMTDTNDSPQQRPHEKHGSRRNEKVGQVVSTKMQKTIVVEVEMRKAHPKYKRVMKTNKKFYAHDEQNSARVGDVVRIRETRPLSKLKRWQLEEIVRRSALAQVEEAAAAARSWRSSSASCSRFLRKPATGLSRQRRRRTMAVQMRTMLEVADNSGARKLQMILPLGGVAARRPAWAMWSRPR